MPEPSDILSRYVEGALAPGLALMQLFLASSSEAEARRALEVAQEGARSSPGSLGALSDLWRETPGAYALVRRIADSATPQARSISDWAAVFDTAAAASPAASVALYSLGRPDLLRNATDELVGLLERRELLGRSRQVLEIGCGIGRTAHAIAPKVRTVVGTDISDAMIAKARGLATSDNLMFVRSNGRDFPFVEDATIDLVLAIDVFPYLVSAGQDTVASNLRECARVLRPDGRALIFNYSYRGNDDQDFAELGELCQSIGLHPTNVGRPLASWDGLLFELTAA